MLLKLYESVTITGYQSTEFESAQQTDTYITTKATILKASHIYYCLKDRQNLHSLSQIVLMRLLGAYSFNHGASSTTLSNKVARKHVIYVVQVRMLR